MSPFTYAISAIGDQADVAVDGSMIKLYLQRNDAEEMSLTMPLAVLESLAVRATELFRVARTRSVPTSAPLETTVGRAAGISAQAAIGTEAVILSIRDEHDLVHRFALHPLQSAELRPKMRQAEIDAKREAQQTRQ